MNKQILNKDEMKEPILEGFHKMASIVAQTLGPGGLPILIQRHGQALNGEPLGPMITKDGVSVANECASPDPKVDIVLQAIKDICRKTNKMVGDGTSTSIILGHAILKESMRLMEQEKVNPQLIREELEASLKKINTKIDEISIPCKSLELVEHVATISANGDRSIGKLIRQAFESVGSEGVVVIDEGTGPNHTLTVVEGYQIQRGAEAQERFFNNSSNTRFEAQDAMVVIYDGKLENPNHVLGILQLIHSKNPVMPPIVFLANEFSVDVIQLLLILRGEQGLKVCAIKGPHTTTVRSQFYEDIALYVGGYKFGNGNRDLLNATLDDIGQVEKITADKYSTILYGGYGSEESVLERIEQLKVQKGEAESPYDASIIADRISYLSEGVAKIGVGGVTDLEIKEAYHRIEDAVNAARVAIEQGIIAGGGATLFRISESLKPETNGDKILKRALMYPLEQIHSNLGLSKEQIDAIKQELLKDPESTWDGTVNTKVKAFEAGIIDPTKVTKSALSASVSIASLMSTCGGAIIYSK
jgi:chaperonin GroEL